MPKRHAKEQKIFFDLDADMQWEIGRLSLDDVLRGQGVQIPTDVQLGEAALPSAEIGVRERDLGLVLSVAPELVLSLGAAASAVILAVSKFLKDREHAPKVLYVHRVEKVSGSEGEPQLVMDKYPVVIEHGPQFKVELEAVLKDSRDLVVRLTAED